MRATFTAALLVAAGLMVAPGLAWASGTLDQSQTDNAGLALGMAGPKNTWAANPDSLAQTFTSGRTGWLDRVDLVLGYLDATGPATSLTVEIRDTTPGAPGSTVLASATVPAASIPSGGFGGWVEADFASPAPVVSGTQYAIVAYAASALSSGLTWWCTDGGKPDLYPRGATWQSLASPPTTWSSEPAWATRDMTFMTYVVASQPVVSSVSPNSGAAGGGTQVTITGKGFVTGDKVVIDQGHGPGIGAIPATAVSVNSSTQITATTSGPAKPGTWHLYVIAPDGTASQATSANAFTYTVT
jgi:hypothetical protein